MSSTRREFLAQGGLAMAGTAVMSHATLNAAPVPGNIPLGFQAFEIVPDLNKDWEGTLKQMAAMGYKLIDMVAMNPYNTRSGKQLRAEFKAVGLDCNVCHFGYASWNTSFGPTVDYANALGVRHVICGPKPKMTTADDWKSMGADLNKFGAAAKKEGLTIAYHNHEIEFVKTPDGQVPYNILMANTDPAVVRFQIDVGNLTFGGGDAVAFMRKYNNRVLLVPCQGLRAGQGRGARRGRRARLEDHLPARAAGEGRELHRGGRRLRRGDTQRGAAREGGADDPGVLQAQRRVAHRVQGLRPLQSGWNQGPVDAGP